MATLTNSHLSIQIEVTFGLHEAGSDFIEYTYVVKSEMEIL